MNKQRVESYTERMRVKAKDLIKSLKETTKKSVNLYIPVDLYEEFVAICEKEKLVISTVVSALIKDFIESYKSKS